MSEPPRPDWSSPIFAHYRALIDKVERHAAMVSDAHASHIACRAGCTACCRQDLSVCTIERDYIGAYVAEHGLEAADPSLTDIDGHELFETLSSGEPCAFLGSAGRCTVYEARPIICRTHGLPIVADGELASCALNFRGETSLSELPLNHRLELGTLNTTFALIEKIYVQTRGRRPR